MKLAKIIGTSAIVIAIFLTLFYYGPSANCQVNTNKIIISSDGSVIGTNSIRRSGNIYSLTKNLSASIVIEKDNMILDGSGFAVQGSGVFSTDKSGLNRYSGTINETAITLNGRSGVTIQNFELSLFDVGIALHGCSNCLITNNTLYENNGSPGDIYLNSSTKNWITYNDLEGTVQNGIRLQNSDNNILFKNTVVNCSSEGIAVAGSHNHISENSIHGAASGAIIIGTSFNNILANNASNSGEGLRLLDKAENNFFSKNIVSHCGEGVIGLDLHSGYNNTFYLNSFIQCSSATLDFNYGNRSIFYCNNFIENGHNVDTHSSSSHDVLIQLIADHNWDNGTNGNYWSDYKTRYANATENTNTGTYDTPYLVTPKDYPYLFYDYYPIVNRVTFSQNATDLPTWSMPTPTPIISNQGLLIQIIVILIVAILIAAVFIFLKKRK